MQIKLPFRRKEERAFYPETANTFTPSLFMAEQNPTVSACVNKIANTLSCLNLQLYAHTKHGKKLAVNNPLFRLLENPTTEETPLLFYRTMISHILLSGNAYIYLSRDSKGAINCFSLVDPRNVRVTRNGAYKKVYSIANGDISRVYTDRDILHIPYIGAGYNGTVGLSPIEAHKELIELDNKLLTYISCFFDNSLGSRYALEAGASYQKNTDVSKFYASIMPAFNKFVLGAKNAGKPMIPPPDMKMVKLDQPSNIEADLHSMLMMTEHQIATSAFNIPYEVIDSEASKYNSLESKTLDFLSNCIQPLGNHICQSFEKLLDPADTHLFIQYEYKQLLTTDTKTTIDYLVKEVQGGLLSINEARSKLGEADLEEGGEYYWIPANLLPVTEDNVQAMLAKSKIAMQEAGNDNFQHSPQGDDNV